MKRDSSLLAIVLYSLVLLGFGVEYVVAETIYLGSSRGSSFQRRSRDCGREQYIVNNYYYGDRYNYYNYDNYYGNRGSRYGRDNWYRAQRSSEILDRGYAPGFGTSLQFSGNDYPTINSQYRGRR